MFFPKFEAYRQSLNPTPITDEERRRILNPILQDNTLKKALGMKMLGDGQDSNNFLGYLLLTGAL